MPSQADYKLKGLHTSVNSYSERQQQQQRFLHNKKLFKQCSTLRSYNKWSPIEHGATLVWRDVCVYAMKNNVNKKNNFKRIINGATGAIKPGTLLALMGASGSGKSTLMSALAYRNQAGINVQGEIMINGRKSGPFMQRLSGFIHQDDLFYGTLTVLEHLEFMANLKLDRRVGNREKKNIINDLLECTGLSKSKNTKIGNIENDNKILSGGEKKRLSFATELLTKPIILFCDEPTTGLDSYSAQQLVVTLQKLAKMGTTIICTIHQPSSQLFAMFHQVLLLSDGRTAFMGAPKEALDFFSNFGYTCPRSYNPADFLISIFASSPGHEKHANRTSQHLCDSFIVSKASQERDLLVNLEMHMAESSEFANCDKNLQFKGPYWFKTVYWLTCRTLLTVVRDPTVQSLRIIQKIAISLMAGLCFFGSINLSQSGVQAVQGALFIAISENSFSPMYSVLSIFPEAFPLVLREKTSGLYSTGQYYLSNMIAMLPGLIVEPLVFMIIGYWLAGLRSTWYAFLLTTFLSILVMNVSTACGIFFSCAFNSVPLAMACLVPFDYILMITSGVFIQLGSMPNYLSWLQYLSWLMYSNEAMTIVQWEGITNITCYEDKPEIPCLHNGKEVLDNYSFSADNLTRDLLALIILYTIFHILGYLFLLKRMRK